MGFPNPGSSLDVVHELNRASAFVTTNPVSHDHFSLIDPIF